MNAAFIYSWVMGTCQYLWIHQIEQVKPTLFSGVNRSTVASIITVMEAAVYFMELYWNNRCPQDILTSPDTMTSSHHIDIAKFA